MDGWIKRLWNRKGLGFQLREDCSLFQPNIIIPNMLKE